MAEHVLWGGQGHGGMGSRTRVGMHPLGDDQPGCYQTLQGAERQSHGCCGMPRHAPEK